MCLLLRNKALFALQPQKCNVFNIQFHTKIGQSFFNMTNHILDIKCRDLVLSLVNLKIECALFWYKTVKWSVIHAVAAL